MASKFKYTFSSGGKQTSTANQVIDFMSTSTFDTSPVKNCSVQYLHIQTFAQSIKIKINNETTIHWVDINSEAIFSDIDIDKITIVDAGVEYYYTAMTID